MTGDGDEPPLDDDDAGLRRAYAAISRCLDEFDGGTWDFDAGARPTRVLTSADLAELQAAAQGVTGYMRKARAARVLLYMTLGYLQWFPNAIEASRKRLQDDYVGHDWRIISRCRARIDKAERASGRDHRAELAKFLRVAVELELEMLTSAAPVPEHRAARLGLREHKRHRLRVVPLLRDEEGPAR